MSPQPLIEAAVALAEAETHDLRCRFMGCTCGIAEERAAIVAEFWRQYRAYKEG